MRETGESAQGAITASDGCRLAFSLEGAVGRPVLVLSNSLGTDRSMWAPQLSMLASEFRLLRYDARGHGASEAPQGAYTLARLGRDVVELIDALDLRRVHFCGLSLGGMTGQWLALNVPDRLDRLVLANTSAHMPPASAWNDRIALVREKGMAAIVDAVIERWFTPAFREAGGGGAVAAVRATFLATNAQGYAGCCAAVRDMDHRALLSHIACPTLVIGGSRDPATPPDHAELLANHIANAQLVMLPAAHLSNVEQPEDFSRTVSGFLGG